MIMSKTRAEINNSIIALKSKLYATDYVDNKITEASVKFLIDGDKTALEMVYLEYKLLLDQRQAWRDEINALEAELEAKEKGNETKNYDLR
jgi:hypothetical protein